MTRARSEFSAPRGAPPEPLTFASSAGSSIGSAVSAGSDVIAEIPASAGFWIATPEVPKLRAPPASENGPAPSGTPANPAAARAAPAGAVSARISSAEASARRIRISAPAWR